MNSRTARRAGAVFLLLLAQPGSGETLQDVIATAYVTSPQLAAARARQEALAETVEQARASGRLVTSIDSTDGYDRLAYGKSVGATIGASLPIWTGGRVRAAVRVAREQVVAGQGGLRDAEAAVLETVIDAFADLLYNQQAVEVARIGIERLDRQVAETQSRFQLGQATRTDVAQLEAQRASVAANLEEAKGALAIVAAAFRATVGHDAGSLSADVPSPALPATLVDARRAAVEHNPLLQQQLGTVRAATARVDVERAERAPLLAATGAYGYGGRLSGGDVIGYTPAAAAGLSLRVPLSTGGLVSSRVRQAAATLRAERFQADAATREAERASDSAWASTCAARARVTTNAQGLTAADLALKGVRAEYAFGLRTTLDILIAEDSFRAAQLALARSRADAIIAEAALLRATGRLDSTAYTVSSVRQNPLGPQCVGNE